MNDLLNWLKTTCRTMPKAVAIILLLFVQALFWLTVSVTSSNRHLKFQLETRESIRKSEMKMIAIEYANLIATNIALLNNGKIGVPRTLTDSDSRIDVFSDEAIRVLGIKYNIFRSNNILFKSN